jgi:predicted metalloendopeptidase
MLLLAAIIAFVPTSRAVAQGTPLEQTVDPTIRPGDDFFSYANGAWLKANPIPAGRERWGVREEITGLAARQITQLLEEATSAPTGSLGRKVADFRNAYLDEGAIEAAGLAPLRPLFAGIDRVRDKAGLTRLLGAGLRADVDPLNWGIYRSSAVLGFSVEQGLGGEGVYLPFLVQGGLGLRDRESYLSADSAALALRTRYEGYIGRMLALAGVPKPDQRAHAVLVLETALARSQATAEASADDHNADHRWTRADFARQAPGMNWTAFFNAAGLGRQGSFIAWQPGALAGVAAQVAAQPLQVWQDYLRFHLLDHYAEVLPHAVAMPAESMHVAAGAAPSGAREDRARSATLVAMSDAVGKLYADRFFPAAEKARVRAVVANVSAAFGDRAVAATWMSPATKAQALVKLRTLYVGVGYPEQWPDVSDLVIDRHDALGNLRRVEARAYRQALAQLGRPIDRSNWIMAPQRVGAILSFQQNAYDFAAALLQAPKYDATASDAATYGAIGAVIGHDVTHYVDRLGADYDTLGAKRHWWTAEDSTRFEATVAPLVAQYSAYRPLPDVALEGQRIETEEVADLGGLVSAFDAHRRSLGDRARDPAYVRQQDREFFIAFAQSWRSRLSEKTLRDVIRTDIHAPDSYRVAIVRNLDAWYDAFDVRPGDKLYLPPESRVRVW